MPQSVIDEYQAVMLGTLLDERYRITQVLGSGGFGQTYIAEDTERPDNPHCVVKHLKPSSQDANFLQVARRLFKTEVEILKRLGSHDQIPEMLAHFEENQEFYFVQEFIEGQTLTDELLTNKQLTEPQVISLLRDVLQVLEFVHSNQVIHRDIKPSNLIRRQRDGKIVLIDFGAVKEIQTQITNEPGQTGMTVGIGTQGYVPSEQLVGKPRFSSDIYALGMTAIHALTGLQPFQLPTHPDTGELIWQSRAEVSPRLATILSRMVRYHFTQRYQSTAEVLYAIDHFSEPLNDLTLMPPTQVSSEEPETLISDLMGGAKPWRTLNRRGFKVVAIASLIVTSAVLGLRQFGILQPLEVGAFDQMMRLQANATPDPRLLVVAITETDIQALKRFPLPDRIVAQALKQINQYQPRVIGLDLLRDVPQESGRAELLAQLKAPNVIAIRNIGDPATAGTPAPPGLSPEQVGFNDFVLDPDGVVRRSLIFADVEKTTLYSFSLRLALAYLAKQGISPRTNPQNPDAFQLGQAAIVPLEASSGGYQTIDASGYQILLNYRSANHMARQVSLTQVLNGKVDPSWIKDKVVLIGTTAASAKDSFPTPYSAVVKEEFKMPGVVVHAQMVSQLLNTALGNQSLFWFWSDWVEGVWVAVWATVGGLVAWCIRSPLILGMASIGVLVVIGSAGFSLFIMQGWVPIVAPTLAAVLAAGTIAVYSTYRSR